MEVAAAFGLFFLLPAPPDPKKEDVPMTSLASPKNTHNSPYDPKPLPLHPEGETCKQLTKEVYPALRDEDFEWMKKTKGGLVIIGEDLADLESPNAKVHRFKTEAAFNELTRHRNLANTTVIHWYDIYPVPQHVGTTCSQTLPPHDPLHDANLHPLDPEEETCKQLTKEVYPALCDEDFEWMKKTKGGLVIMGVDLTDLESPNAKVHRFKTEEAFNEFTRHRNLANTTVIHWHDIYKSLNHY